MEIIIGLLVGIAGIGATAYFAVETLKMATRQSSESLSALAEVRVELARIETMAKTTQDALLRERFEVTQSEAEEQAERAVRRAGETLHLEDNQINTITAAVRDAVADTLGRATEGDTPRQEIDVSSVPADVLDEIRATLGLDVRPSVQKAWERPGRGPKRWFLFSAWVGRWKRPELGTVSASITNPDLSLPSCPILNFSLP